MITLLQTATVILFLQGNTLYFSRPQQDLLQTTSQTGIVSNIKAYPIYDASGSNGQQHILAYGQETDGPHIWALTARLEFQLVPNPVNNESNLHLQYRLRPQLYVKRTMEASRWERFSGRELVKGWVIDQQRNQRQREGHRQHSLSNRFAYPVPDIESRFRLARQYIIDNRLLEMQKKVDSEQKPMAIDDSQVSAQQKQALVAYFRSMMLKNISSFWSDYGLVIWFRNPVMRYRAMYIYLGNYSYRTLPGNILAMTNANPGSKMLAINGRVNNSRQFLLLRLADTSPPNPQIVLSSIENSKDQTSHNMDMRDLHFRQQLGSILPGSVGEGGDALALLMSKEPKLEVLSGNHYFASFGQASWLLDQQGKTLWQAGSQANRLLSDDIKVPEGKGMLVLSSKDYFSLAANSEKLVFLKVYVDKYEVGRTEPTIGSRAKKYEVALHPGRHLLNVERWELQGAAYHKAKQIMQPGPVHIEIISGQVHSYELRFQPNLKPTIVSAP